MNIPFVAAALGLLALGCRPQSDPAAVGSKQPVSLLSLLAIPSDTLAEIPVVTMSLLSAEGLAGKEGANLEACAASVSTWADRVRTETSRHAYRFRQNPAAFEHSEGFFKMLMMAVVLAEDFHVHYKQDLKTEPGEARVNDGFFTNPADVFLHGLLGPNREGTCSSMPVLYVAIGRELRYPLKLVTTKGHMFVRWEGAGERFNIEATAHGLSRFDDEYYRHWPFEITKEEEAAEGYLKSLTPSEELAAFLSIRGMCLREAGRIAEAADAFAAAARLAPGCRS